MANDVDFSKPDNYFGSTLKEFRLQQTWTQEKAAREAGLKQSQWAMYERGLLRPNFEMVLYICAKLKISPLPFVAKSYAKFTGVDPDEELSISEYEECINNGYTPAVQSAVKERISQRLSQLQNRLLQLS